MKSRCYYANPTGNITLLIPSSGQDNSFPDAGRLTALEPTVQQAGFLSAGGADYDIALQMAGGEFCGNATLSAAAIFCMQTVRQAESRGPEIVRVKASGAAAPVSVLITEEGQNRFRGTVSMPAPLEIISIPYENHTFPAVLFEGITHVIAPFPLPKATAEKAVRQICTAAGADALGIMQLELEKRTLIPLVYVPKSGTLCWEGSCASGTTAVGAYLRNKYGPGKWSFLEPEGTLTIEAPADGRLLLTGTVSIEERFFDFSLL